MSNIQIGTRVLVPVDAVRDQMQDEGWLVLSGRVLGTAAGGRYYVIRLDGARPIHARSAITVHSHAVVAEPSGLPDTVVTRDGVWTEEEA